MRVALLSVVVGLVACGEDLREKHLDTALIHVVADATMRTDQLGDGKFAERATFVLVDAENTAGEGAYVTLDGTLADAHGAEVGTLKPQSLWIPAHATRTFSLVDRDRQARPTAAAASVVVRGALVPAYAPTAVLSDQKITDDGDKVIVSAKLTNPSERPGKIVVIAAFHDAAGTPMTRPFDVVNLDAKASIYLQYVGPKRSKRAMMFLGDESY